MLARRVVAPLIAVGLVLGGASACGGTSHSHSHTHTTTTCKKKGIFKKKSKCKSKSITHHAAAFNAPSSSVLVAGRNWQ